MAVSVWRKCGIHVRVENIHVAVSFAGGLFTELAVLAKYTSFWSKYLVARLLAVGVAVAIAINVDTFLSIGIIGVAVASNGNGGASKGEDNGLERHGG